MSQGSWVQTPLGGTIPCWSIRALLLGSPPPHIHSGLRGLGCRTLPKGHHTNSSQRLENGAAEALAKLAGVLTVDSYIFSCIFNSELERFCDSCPPSSVIAFSFLLVCLQKTCLFSSFLSFLHLYEYLP